MSELRVNFCCGGNLLQNWENRDIDCDITKPLPYESGTVKEALCEHGLEHVNCGDALRFLDECYRILQPGGMLRVCVPVLDRLPKDHARDIVFNHGHQCAYTSESLYHLIRLSGLNPIGSGRRPEDGHWKIIGTEKDDLETARIDCMKPRQ